MDGLLQIVDHNGFTGTRQHRPPIEAGRATANCGDRSPQPAKSGPSTSRMPSPWEPDVSYPGSGGRCG